MCSGLFHRVTSEEWSEPGIEGESCDLRQHKPYHEIMIGITRVVRVNFSLLWYLTGIPEKEKLWAVSVKAPLGSIWRWQLRWQTPPGLEAKLNAEQESAPLPCVEYLPIQGRSSGCYCFSLYSKIIIIADEMVSVYLNLWGRRNF